MSDLEDDSDVTSVSNNDGNESEHEENINTTPVMVKPVIPKNHSKKIEFNSLYDEKAIKIKVQKAAIRMQEAIEEYNKYIQEEKIKLQIEREALEKERKEFEEEKKKMEHLIKCQESIIELNVGGEKFTTSLETLCADPHSMLAAMFSGRYKLTKDKKGRYFIDRDPKHFCLILNFLRTNSLPSTLTKRESEELLLEAEFYNIQGLLEALQFHTPGVKLVKQYDAKSALFRWKLYEFSKLSPQIESEIFTFCQQSFYLRLFPRGDKDSNGFVTLFLIFAGPNPTTKLRFKLKLINFYNPMLSHIFEGGCEVFKLNNGWGKSKFYPNDKLEPNGFLLDDSIVIEVYLKLEQ